MKTFDSPWDRFKTVTLGLLTDQSGPNVLAGTFITALLGALVRRVPWWWAAVTAAAWLLSVVTYSIADEVTERIEAERNRLLDPLDDGRPRGIE